MTTLIVKPIDLSAPGSYGERKRYLRLLKQLRSTEKRTTDTTISTMEEMDRLITGRLRTDDGTPVEDALDQLSAQQFDALLSAIAFESGVGEANTGHSNDGPEDSLAPGAPIG